MMSSLLFEIGREACRLTTDAAPVYLARSLQRRTLIDKANRWLRGNDESSKHQEKGDTLLRARTLLAASKESAEETQGKAHRYDSWMITC